MRAMVLTEHGGMDKLVYQADYPDPKAGPGQADRKSTRLNSSHSQQSRMPSSA